MFPNAIVRAGVVLSVAVAAAFCEASAPLLPEQIAAKSLLSMAIVLLGGADREVLTGMANALVVRENAILLTPYHAVKNAKTLQVRFKNGEVFDDVKLLGVDARRDIAALKISAVGLPVVPFASPSQAKVGEAVVLIGSSYEVPWSVATGTLAAYRMADELPGAGSGFKLLQVSAPVAASRSGAALFDSQGRALGLLVGNVRQETTTNFGIPVESVIGLADAAPTQTFANGSALSLPNSPLAPATKEDRQPAPAPDAPERSNRLDAAKTADTILRTFKTMYIDARRARHFDSAQVKATLLQNKDFAALQIRTVDDPKLADVVLEVGYTFAWDFPFQLKHLNTATVLFAGKGMGPFSGPAGATSVAKEFVKPLKPFRP